MSSVRDLTQNEKKKKLFFSFFTGRKTHKAWEKEQNLAGLVNLTLYRRKKNYRSQIYHVSDFKLTEMTGSIYSFIFG